jgi:hypothetical protein
MKPQNLLPALVLVLIWALLAHPVAGQESKQPAQAGAGEAAVAAVESSPAMPTLEIKAYRVADLLIATPSYPYNGRELPTVQGQEAGLPLLSAMSAGGMGGGMFMGGMGGMGGMGLGAGGMETSAPNAETPQSGAFGEGRGMGGVGKSGRGGRSGWGARSPLFNSPDDLIEAITAIIDPASWDDVGGPGSLTFFGGLLLVNQTSENHEKIDELLETIRSEGTTAQTVVVDARWLVLDAAQLDELLGQDPAKSGSKSPLTVDSAACERLSRERPGYRGRITCFNGQTVHLVSGTRRSVVTGAIPVVGSGIGYQPQTATPNFGVLLQVTPSLLPGTDAAILDVQSTVTKWVEPERIPVVGSRFQGTRRLDPASHEMVDEPGGEASLVLDRLAIPAQQLATALRVPLDKPVLVGGLTLEPPQIESGETKTPAREQLYLVVQVSAAEGGNGSP